jgi:PAS domain S-box-containing protein
MNRGIFIFFPSLPWPTSGFGYDIKIIFALAKLILNLQVKTMPHEHERFRMMVEDSQDWFWEFDENANFTYASPRIRDLLGYEPEELIGQNAFDLMDADEAERVRKHFDPIAKKYLPFNNLQNTNLHKDGHEVVIESSGTPIFDEKGWFRGYRGIDRDITDRIKAEADLLKRKKLFRDFFESNPAATIVTSPSGMIHMINPAFEMASGFSAEEVVGRTSQELGFWREPGDRERMVSAIMEHGSINNLEASFYPKDKQPMTLLVSSRAVEYDGEKRILSALIDVTAQRKAEETLRKLDQAKNEFIKTAAHELQTPLVAVLGYAELLENTDPIDISAQHKRYASIIRKNAEILSRLVHDLLDVESIQLGRRLSIVREDVSFSGLINKAIASITPKCPEHRFVLTHANSLPETMRLDEDRIIQVLHNLLINAVKYSPEGRIVELATTTEERSVSISVRDYGLGMTREQIEQMFDKFYRADPNNPQVGGLGLGMTIVKQIVEDHGGNIYISSVPGEGTTVTLTFPRENVVKS